MSLANTIFPNGVPDNLADFGIVISAEQKQTLVALQDNAGLNLHRVSPVPLTDGRYVVRADVLSEARSGGLFSRVDLIDESNLSGIIVLPWADVVALLPAPILVDL